MEPDHATQTYIGKFRIKELHTVLKRLGLNSQGLKNTLVQRLVNYIKNPSGVTAAPEEADRVREFATGTLPPVTPSGMNATQQHRGTAQQNPGLAELYPQEPPGFVPGRKAPAPIHYNGAQNGFTSQHLPARAQRQNSSVRCPCGLQAFSSTDELLPCHICTKAGRNTLQHGRCMGYDMKKLTASQRASHMCEQCRLDHSDPFWKQFPEAKSGDLKEGWILPMMWLKRQPGAEPNQQGNVNLYFQADVRLPSSIVNERRRNKDIQIQAVCLATSDSNVCQNRMHWPDRMEVRVRSQTARVMSRNHKLGANGRDSATDLTPWLNRDATSLQVSVKAVGQENCFLFGVRAVVPRPLEAVIAMLGAPETPEDAVKRVAHAVGGGADDDDDDIIMGDTLVVSLRDQLSSLRVQRGLRVVGGKSLQPFDMDFFLDSAKRSRKWQCPVSMKNVLIHQLQPDRFMNAVLYALRNQPSITEIHVNKDGLWRAGEDGPWQNIVEGPPESFELPPKREDVVADAGASSSCLSGQKRPREEDAKASVSTLNKQPDLGPGRPVQGGGNVQTSRSTPFSIAQAARTPPEKSAEVITISDSDDDEPTHTVPPPPPPAAPAAQSLPAPPLPGNLPPRNPSSGTIPAPMPAVPVPPIQIQYGPGVSAHHATHPPPHHHMPLAPQMPGMAVPGGNMPGMPAATLLYGYPAGQAAPPHHQPPDSRQTWRQ